jgi:hypothetical protein
MMIAMPVASQHALPISWRLSQRVATGRYSALELEAQQNYTELLCEDNDAIDEDDVTTFQLECDGPRIKTLPQKSLPRVSCCTEH